MRHSSRISDCSPQCKKSSLHSKHHISARILLIEPPVWQNFSASRTLPRVWQPCLVTSCLWKSFSAFSLCYSTSTRTTHSSLITYAFPICFSFGFLGAYRFISLDFYRNRVEEKWNKARRAIFPINIHSFWLLLLFQALLLISTLIDAHCNHFIWNQDAEGRFRETARLFNELVWAFILFWCYKLNLKIRMRYISRFEYFTSKFSNLPD